MAAFAVDDGFSYAVPPELDLEVGAIVRVPLGGRKVRGYVIDVRRGDTAALKPVTARSGDLPVFDSGLLQTVRWAAVHYVAPLASLLNKTAPPNLPRRRKLLRLPEVEVQTESPVPAVSAAAAAGRHHAPVFWAGLTPSAGSLAALAAPVLAAGKSVLLITATLVEAGAIFAEMGSRFGERAMVATSALTAAEATTTWVRATSNPGVLMVGTREIALWPIADIGLAIVVDEARRGMKDKATPTVHARDLIRRRSSVERFPVVFTGSVPSLELLAAGTSVVQQSGRPWSLVEIVDRREEPPQGTVLTRQALAAIKAVSVRGDPVLIFTHRRTYASAFRCSRCGDIRRCPECRGGADQDDTCLRCGARIGACHTCGGRRFQPLGAGVGRLVDELNRRIGPGTAGTPGTGAGVVVATERDLIRLPRFALVVVVDADALLLRPTYRSEEDGLRLLARVAQQVGRGSGRRTMVQTSMPDHPALEALRRADVSEFVATTLEQRRRDGFPPSAELLVVEAGGGRDKADEELRDTVGDRASVLGPAPAGERDRWLITGPDLRPVRIRLRMLVQRWRDAGTTVRIDADPLDL